MTTGAVLVAAGSGMRAGGMKQFELLAGKPLFIWALEALVACSRVDRLAVAVPEGHESSAAALWSRSGCDKDVRFLAGGQRRQDSVRGALEALNGCEWVVVHDAARPMITVELIEQTLAAARACGAASVGTPVTDALKRIDSERVVVETVSRESLWAVQTPQAFRMDLLRRAHAAITEDVPDDAAMVERIGGRVALLEGPTSNIKLTTRQDFALAEAMLGQARDA